MAWEERWHPLREEWVVIAAHRQNRPWAGEIVKPSEIVIPEYLPDCPLCPGNMRQGDVRTIDYKETFVFNNDSPSFGERAPDKLSQPTGIYRNKPASGIARVVCYNPKHNSSLAEMQPSEIEKLMAVWQDQYLDLGGRPDIASVLIFENKGEVVGVSNPHPHGQIYATNFVFKTIETEAGVCQRHYAETRRVLFQDIIAAEKRDGLRILAENDTAIAFIPYFARYAYEVYVVPKETHPCIATLSQKEVADLAAVLKKVLVKFDNLWEISFPYVMALHQAPTDGGDYHAFHFHIEIHPPLRKPSLLKYLAGPEIGGGNFLSDTAPEEKAAELLAIPDVHYKLVEKRNLGR